MFCDDIRQEATGKEILIGVYNSGIIVSSLPARLPTLWFRINASLERTTFNTVLFAIKTPSGKDAIRVEYPAGVLTTDEPTNFSLAVGSPHFLESGQYEVLFGLDALEKIGEFAVRLPASEDERKRVSRERNP